MQFISLEFLVLLTPLNGTIAIAYEDEVIEPPPLDEVSLLCYKTVCFLETSSWRVLDYGVAEEPKLTLEFNPEEPVKFCIMTRDPPGEIRLFRGRFLDGCALCGTP